MVIWVFKKIQGDGRSSEPGRLSGFEHPDVGNSIVPLAQMLIAQGKYVDALTWLRQATRVHLQTIKRIN